MADNCWVCTVEMHARRGAEITWIYPEEDASATRRAVFEAELPFACLGEASSSRARDVRDAAATRFVVASGERRYFGCSASRTDCGDGAERGARQRAVAIVAATPVFDLLAEKVLVLASLPPDDDDTRASLRAAQASVAKEACGSRYDDFAAACPCRAVVKRLGAKAVADTTLAAALAAKVVIYGASPAKASECCLALAALQPGLVSLGLTRSLEDVNPRLHVHAFRWRARGFPLLDYAAWPVQPLATVATVDRYAPEGALDGASDRGYCVATCVAASQEFSLILHLTPRLRGDTPSPRRRLNAISAQDERHGRQAARAARRRDRRRRRLCGNQHFTARLC